MSIGSATLAATSSPWNARAPLAPESLPVCTFAFQPIVDIRYGRVCSYEALARGMNAEPAAELFRSLSPGTLRLFDSECRTLAIALAAELGIDCDLNLNVLPQSFETEAAFSATVAAARYAGLSPSRLVMEITEGEILSNQPQLRALADRYRALGFKLAIDDFGAGYSGLNLLAEFHPDQLKLDANLVRAIHRSGPRQAIVRAIIQVCRDLGVDLIAEGVETVEEYDWFCNEGVSLFQGFLFARAGFQSLPLPRFPERP